MTHKQEPKLVLVPKYLTKYEYAFKVGMLNFRLGAQFVLSFCICSTTLKL